MNYAAKTEELVIPLIEELGLIYVDTEYVKEGSDWYLRIYADKEGGITINDCEQLSGKISDLLDEKDFIKDAYILEVSSPGILRPLKKERDYERNLGKLIEVRTFKPIQDEKEFVGTLKAFDEQTVTLVTDENKELTFTKKDLSLIRQYAEF